MSRFTGKVFTLVVLMLFLSATGAHAIGFGWLLAGSTALSIGVGLINPLAGLVCRYASGVVEVGIVAASAAKRLGERTRERHASALQLSERSDITTTTPPLPDDPTSSPALRAAALAVAQASSAMMQTALRISDSDNRARLAEDLGMTEAATQQRIWSQQFREQSDGEYRALGEKLATMNDLTAVEFPEIWGYVFTSPDLIATRDREAAGSFNEAETAAIAAWGLTPSEIEDTKAEFALGTDAEIVACTPVTAGAAMTNLAAELSAVPEPSSVLALGGGLACLAGMAVRRRR